MIRKIFSFCLILICLLTGCGLQESALKHSQQMMKTQYKGTFLDMFDTVTTIVGYAESEEAFQEVIKPVHDQLLEYHQLFDIYHTYEGMNNLKTVNDQAGIAAVAVDKIIIELLLDCKKFCDVTDGKVNAAMGGVLSLWHEARTEGVDDPLNARLPDEQKLKEAAMHMSFDAVMIDEEASTVYIEDPDVRLDVGAIAKGWAAQKAAEAAPKGLLISLGGNVCATGPKDENGTPWVVGIQNPDGEADEYLHTVYITDQCVVTSGDYQRVYVVDGKGYHHIIDPETLYPSENWRAVTVICKDSGLADMMSTALFLLSQEEGQVLLDQFDAVAIWVEKDGTIIYSPGFKDLIRT